ncbi:MAG: hypothetical protein AAGC71_11870 [Pseudomonadota bacterium]
MKTFARKTLFVFLTVIAAQNPALAFQPFGGPARPLGENPVIGGISMTCYGIPTVVQHIQDIAFARPGVIILSPRFFNEDPAVQRFIYAHECAHHVLGSNESAADCWAMQIGRDQGWLSRRDATAVAHTLSRTPGSITHPPGPIRAEQAMRCYRS